MYKFAFMLKTYSKDVQFVRNLVKSFKLFNSEKLPLFILVPSQDEGIFSEFKCETITIIPEETISVSFFEQSYDNISPGYLNQQIVKLAFWKLNLCENYLCIDSDNIFIRDFGIDEFLTPSGLPYTVLIEDRELQCDPEYHRVHWQSRAKSLLKIQEFLGLDKRLKLMTCHTGQILSKDVLVGMERDLLCSSQKTKLTYKDLLMISPYEFSWYNYYLQTLDIKIYSREPYFKMYHSSIQLLKDLVLGVRQQDLARGYLGLILNSNLSADRKTPLTYEPTLLKDLLSRVVPLPTLITSSFMGLKRIPTIINQRFFRRLN